MIECFEGGSTGGREGGGLCLSVRIGRKRGLASERGVGEEGREGGREGRRRRWRTIYRSVSRERREKERRQNQSEREKKEEKFETR